MVIQSILPKSVKNISDKPDCCAFESKLLPLDMAITNGFSLAKPLSRCVDLPLLETMGRVSFDTLVAKHPLPNFNNSAMDGYAINTKALPADGPHRLKIGGRIVAGASYMNLDELPPE